MKTTRSPTTSTGSRLAALSGNRWFRLVWIIPVALLVLAGVVLAARGIRSLPDVQSFLTQFPGTTTLPESAPVGFPAWLNWQHGLNAFFILFVIRSGWQIHTTKRPTMFWKRNNTGLLRTRRAPNKMSLSLWLHITFDTLWVANGVLFYILLFATGQWLRLVPVTWSIFPNALSAMLQYASLDWPVESGWVNYNAIQTISYFLVVFVAAPLALLTGLRMSPSWTFRRLSKVYPIGVARAVHYPVMIFFVAFIVVHVVLVFSTGALRNLNHMYAARNDDGWLGFGVFAAALVLMIVAWVAARPVILRAIASLTGTVSR
ncbi:membrane protein [Cryobacterium sp. MLB-32]|uniref:cytochrome b/b6 domain-containing protein n=1 Tax=Cryobacterium sp. MLB-32 TaxID=1529318 RepID=UPI0004E7A85E|nr:cytochrome b/b6 domain-containing protein [Cryobacterium sp. MLB-32]KFF59470.1 membrane protein [Cryobacterium sp. MLB-32]